MRLFKIIMMGISNLLNRAKLKGTHVGSSPDIIPEPLFSVSPGFPINDTKQYINQYYDVKDIPETPEREPLRTCNWSCVAMITGEDVNILVREKIKLYGTREFNYEEKMIGHLQTAGYKCTPITKTAYPNPRQITIDEIKLMCKEIDNGKIIFYHKDGHYQLMIGYVSDNEFVFNDPAGDRKLQLGNRDRESGHRVKYPLSMLFKEEIFGRCWSIEI